MSIPFFMLAAEIMVRTDISRKLFAFARLFVGRFRGGLAFVNVIASTIFGSISGSAIGDMTGLGAIEIAEMEKEGYDKDFSIALLRHPHFSLRLSHQVQRLWYMPDVSVFLRERCSLAVLDRVS